MSTFSRYAEIEGWLREQWAGLFREFLKRTSESQQIASLSAQVSQLSELNKTFKTYLENLMTSISPEKSKAVIETESNRLEEIQKKNAIADNGFVKFLGNHGIDPEESVKLIDKARDFEDFINQIGNVSGIETSKRIRRLEGSRAAERDFNEARAILLRPPILFKAAMGDDRDLEAEISPDLERHSRLRRARGTHTKPETA